MRMLLVEDSDTDAELVVRELRKSFPSLETERIETAAAMRVALTGAPWDVIICDWALPRFSALEALSLLKDTGLDVPFIIVSGTVNEDSAVRAMRGGAHDYLQKDKLGRLAPAVEREIREAAERKARREAEDALRRSLARFGRLSDSGIVGIITCDVRGNIVEANDAYLKMLGYSRQDFIAGGLNWLAIAPPEFREADERALQLLQVDGVSPPREKELTRKDGSRVPVLITVAMLDYPECIALVADISGRKSTEKALVESQEQFRQSQKMEAIGTLAGGIAHDFNNILGAILGYGELASEHAAGDADLRRYLDNVLHAAQRAKLLVERILGFSRIGLGDRAAVNMQSAVAETLDLLEASLPAGIRLARTLDVGDAAVIGDATYLHQVTMNLCTNALQAMDRSGVLGVSLERCDVQESRALTRGALNPGPYVRLTVSDTGPGIPAAVLERIFDPFFTTKGVGAGTGLGLSLVDGIVSDLGGAIEVATRAGEGTRFEVWLPVMGEAAQPGTEQVAALPRGNGETVMIVDDEAALVALAEENIARLGYEPVGFQSSVAALEAFQANPERFDAVLTDETMPDLAGTELARKIRVIRPALPILLMSGYGGPQLANRTAALGVDSALRKPLHRRELADALSRVLKSRS